MIVELVALTFLLSIVRYLIGIPIEAVTIMEPMHRMMSLFPEVFDNDYTTRDFVISLVLLHAVVSAALAFHAARPALRGPTRLRSFKVFGIMPLFYASLAAIT